MAEVVAARQPAQPQRAHPQRAAARPAQREAIAARAGVDRLQRALGNRAMHRLLLSGTIQAKLAVGPADDEYEREADRVADEVMRMPEPASGLTAQRSILGVQRVCPECEEEVQAAPLPIQRRCRDCDEGEVQRQADDLEASPDRPIGILLSGEVVVQRSPRGNAPPAKPIDGTLERRVNALQGHGEPLPLSERGFMESRFGYSFDAVRIHTGSRAGELASALKARAFTLGNNVVFGAGEYRPATATGRSLLAHELTHVIQQVPARVHTIQRQPQDETTPMSQAEENRLSLTSPGRAAVQASPPALSLFNFGHDRHEPKTFHRAVLREFAGFLRDEFQAPMRIRVVGHASAPGTIAHNLGLSRRRAEAVAAILRAEGMSRVDVFASGESDPVASNDTVEGRSRNRRVDLHVSALPGPRPQPPGPGPEPKPPEPPEPPEPPPPERNFCDRYPILCSLLPIPIPFLPFLVCLIAPELCALLPCLIDPLLCIPPPQPPRPPRRRRRPDPPPIVIFGRVRASNTPATMDDRIPDQGSTAVSVLVLGLRPSHGPLVIGRVGNGARNGDFLINGGATATITGSTLLEVAGVMQTSTLAGGFNLHLEALLGGAPIALSRAFAVSDIMENMRTRKEGEIVDATGATLDVRMLWDSDGAAGLASLTEMEYGENLAILLEEGGMVGLGLGSHGFLALASIEQIDSHGTPRGFMRVEGRQELLQVHTLVDHRTGSLGEDIPVTNSGFGINRVVEPDPARSGCLRFVVTKFGRGGTANGFTSGAGSGQAELIVPLPCGGGGGGDAPSTPTIPTPHLGPLPSGTTPFGLVGGVPCDPAPGLIVNLRIFFSARSTNPLRPGRRVFTTTIPCVVDDTTSTSVFLITLNPVPLSLAPRGFELTVMPARKRIVIPKSMIC